MVFAGIVAADEDHETARRLVQAGTILPLEKILALHQNIQQGRILEVELERHHGRFIYEVEWVNRQGIVWETELDATNGALLKQKREN
ncbi:MAG: PepSY domain-containing protein [Magnetococcales bacterium]|nr:PepSY domain-containing protein [Magnetococcales bacterium]